MLSDRLHVSVGNTKIGKTANVSLLPIVTCPQGVPCVVDCYARKLAYPTTVVKAWMDNTAFAMNDPQGFMESVLDWLEENKPKFFRWHVSGDIPNKEYQRGMEDMAVCFPETSFLVFTKRTEYVWEKRENLRVFFSAWIGAEMPSRAVLTAAGFTGVAYIEGDERAPKDAMVCKGRCDSCRACWKKGEAASLLLHKH
jgi:hypothetical protein